MHTVAARTAIELIVKTSVKKTTAASQIIMNTASAPLTAQVTSCEDPELVT